jgi:hypothetical protein
MAQGNAQSEKRKKIIAAVLMLVMVIVVVYQFIGGPSKPSRNSQPEDDVAETAAPAAGAPRQQPPALAPPAQDARRASSNDVPNDATPLDLSLLMRVSGSAQAGPRGNVFDYYKEPPPKPAPLPPPPPITVQFIQPSNAVAGTPRRVTLVVTAQKLPADPVILFNGAPKPTKRINETQLSMELAPGDYAAQGNYQIGVISQADPKYNSTFVPFVVQAAPEPQFRYIGRIGDVAVIDIPAQKEVKRYKRGDKILNIWQIDSITDQAMEITHVQYEIKKRVIMQDRPR